MEIWHSRRVSTPVLLMGRVVPESHGLPQRPAQLATHSAGYHLRFTCSILIHPTVFETWKTSFLSKKQKQKLKIKALFKRPSLLQSHSLNIVHQMGEREHKQKTLCSMHCDCFAAKCPCFKSGSCSPIQKSCLLFSFGLTFHCTQTFLTKTL